MLMQCNCPWSLIITFICSAQSVQHRLLHDQAVCNDTSNFVRIKQLNANEYKIRFLHERTKNKINIFSHEPSAWKQAILADVNPEELPASYGGTMTDPDGNPNCITIVCQHCIMHRFCMRRGNPY